jgi:uncharacterized membrane protein (DUF441 family)
MPNSIVLKRLCIFYMILLKHVYSSIKSSNTTLMFSILVIFYLQIIKIKVEAVHTFRNRGAIFD